MTPFFKQALASHWDVDVHASPGSRLSDVHAPAWQVAPPVHETQRSPSAPQLALVVPLMHVPEAVQHPSQVDSQLLEPPPPPPLPPPLPPLQAAYSSSSPFVQVDSLIDSQLFRVDACWVAQVVPLLITHRL